MAKFKCFIVKRKVPLILIIIFSCLIFKVSIFDGYITCKPYEYKDTLIELMWAKGTYNEKLNEIKKVIPLSMSVDDARKILEDEGFVVTTSKRYQNEDLFGEDYVITFQTRINCIRGEYVFDFGLLIREDKVYDISFAVSRTFFLTNNNDSL